MFHVDISCSFRGISFLWQGVGEGGNPLNIFLKIDVLTYFYQCLLVRPYSKLGVWNLESCFIYPTHHGHGTLRHHVTHELSLSSCTQHQPSGVTQMLPSNAGGCVYCNNLTYQ